MGTDSVSRPLLALVHHVELNKAGWWAEGVKQAVLYSLHDSASVPLAHIAAAVTQATGIQFSQAQAKSLVTELEAQGRVVQVADRVKLSESCRTSITADMVALANLEKRVSERFSRVLSEVEPALAFAVPWDTFNAECLTPMVKELGARTYDIIVGERSSVANTQAYSQFLKSQLAHAEQLVSAITTFLDPADEDVRGYILRILNAFFFVQSSSLSAETLASIDNLTAQPPELCVLVDTNFIFSLLGLHDNPSDDAARTLIGLASEVSQSARVRFFVAPITLRETREAIRAKRSEFASISWSPALAGALTHLRVGGFLPAFLESYAASGETLSPQLFFDALETNLVQLLGTRGIEPLEEFPSDIEENDDVLRDVRDELYLERERTDFRKKGRDSILHDVALWHAVRRLRPAYVAHFAEAKYWIVTIDYRLLDYDRRASANWHQEVPLCMHPSNLAQVLQFWVPRSFDLQSAVVGSLRLPFMLRSFDVEAERTTLAILHKLSEYEGARDLSEGSLLRVLTNQALRLRVGEAENHEVTGAGIRDAIVTELEETQAALAEAKRRAASLEVQVTSGTLRSGTKAQAINGQAAKKRELLAQQGQLETRIHELTAVVGELKDSNEAHKRDLDTEHQRNEVLEFYLWRGAALGTLAALVAVVAFFVVALVSRVVGFSSPADTIIGAVAAVLVMAGYAVLLSRMAQEQQATRETPLARAANSSIKVTMWFIVPIVIGVASNIVYAVLRESWTPPK